MTEPRSTPSMVVLVDIAALVVALVAGVSVWSDTDLFVRPVAALCFIIFVPGWTLLRLFDVPISSLMFLVAFVLSIVVMVFTSILLATRLNWTWEPLARLWAFGCAVGLAIVLLRLARPEAVRP